MTETANNVLGKHRQAKKPWVTDSILKLCDKRRELKQNKNTTDVHNFIEKPTNKFKKRHKKSKGDIY